MNRHVTDRQLVQGLDGELPCSLHSAVARHLDECEACSARRAAIASAAYATVALYREDSATDESVVERSRGRLEAALTREGQTPNRTSAVLAPVLAVAAAIVFAVSATSYFRSSPVAVSGIARHGLALPMASMTPGATRDVSVEELCSGTIRPQPITAAMRAEVLNAYGVGDVPADLYELDYLITPELGGATDPRNLWPQRYGSPIWNARVKDELERLLPQMVCRRELDLATAQRDMAVDWVAAYKKYFNTTMPLDAHRGPSVDDDDSSSVYLLADNARAPAIQLVSLTAMR